MTIGRRILLRLFGRPTGVLGRLGGVIMARLNRDAAARVVDLLELEPGDRVLEIGFGPGVGIEILSQRGSVRSIAGIDPSREMIAQATARNTVAIGTGRVELLRASVDQMPFVDREFDKIVSVNSMQVWPDAVAGMREVRRVLRAGGRVALGFTPYAGYSNAAVIGVLAAAGFGEPRVVESLEVSCVIATKR